MSHDKHIRVKCSPEPIPDRKPDAAPPAAEMKRFRDQMKFWNAGCVKAERLDGNVGYLRLDGFAPGGRGGADPARLERFLQALRARGAPAQRLREPAASGGSRRRQAVSGLLQASSST